MPDRGILHPLEIMDPRIQTGGMSSTVGASPGSGITATRTMRAVVLEAVNSLAVREVPAPHPAAGEVIVRLRAAALNHRDVWIKQGKYAGLKFPIIPGSDGSGVVTDLGAGAPS